MAQPYPSRSADLDLTARHAEQVAVARVRDGDPLALEMIFQAYGNELLSAATRMAGSRELGEEVVQEVFFAIWRARSRWQVASSLRAYLRRAVQNTALRMRASHVRGGPAHESLDAPGTGGRMVLMDRAPTPVENAALNELAAAAERATAAMSPKARDVFLLRRNEELSNREIADRLGVSVKTVETHMRRALRFMRRHLAPWLDGRHLD